MKKLYFACVTLYIIFSIPACINIKKPTLNRKQVLEKTTKEISKIQENDKDKSELVLNAIKNNDLNQLKNHLKDVDDVKTLFDKDVLLLHLSEEVANDNSDKNFMTEFLISKRASIYQIDSDGLPFYRNLYEDERIAGTPRADYIDELRQIINSKYSEIFKNDDDKELQNLQVNFYLNLNNYSKYLYSMATRNSSQKIISFLIKEKVKWPDDILHIIINQYSYSESFDKTEQMLKLFIDNGANLNATNKKNENILISLLNKVSGHQQMLDRIGNVEPLAIYMIEKGANCKNTIELAADKNYINLTKILISKGDDLSDAFKKNSNFVYNASNEMINLAIENNVDPYIFIPRLSIIEKQQDQLELLNLLLTKKVSVNDIDAKLLNKHFDNVKHFINLGGKIKEPDFFLVSMIKKDHQTVDFDYIFNHGASLDIENHPKNSLGYSYLHYVILEGFPEKKLEYAKYFLQKGVNINAISKNNNETPLDASNRKKISSISEYLEANGAKKNK